jgi:polygalacturonase
VIEVEGWYFNNKPWLWLGLFRAGDALDPLPLTNGRSLLAVHYWPLITGRSLADGSNQRQRPSLMKLLWVDGLRITRLTLRDSPFWFIHPVYCNDVALAHVAAVAPADSRNTDGFDPDSCTNVHVTDCVFETGDDCIAVKSGRCVTLWIHSLSLC